MSAKTEKAEPKTTATQDEKDGLAALDALEKEASEFTKASPQFPPPRTL
jgi:hypothetical protein